MKKLLPVILMVASGFSYADEQQTDQVVTQEKEAESQPETTDNGYIFRGNYTQNPYVGMPSGGGTQNISESEFARDNVAQKWFTDGTWNVFGAASYVDQNGANNYGYAVNIFGQTGQVAGFSFGGLLTVANPFFSSQWNPAEPENQAQGLSVAQQVTPQELFAEYQYSNIIQADAGWIGISN